MTYTLIWHCAILVSFIDSLYTVMQDRRLCWISSADLTSTWYCSHVGSVRKPPCWWSNFLHIGVQSMPRWPCTMADCQRCTCCGAEHSATIHITTNAEHALIIGEHRPAALFQPAAGERKSEKNLKLCTCASFCAAPRQMTGQLLHRFSWCTLPQRAINDAALVDGATGTRHGRPQALSLDGGSATHVASHVSATQSATQTPDQSCESECKCTSQIYALVYEHMQIFTRFGAAFPNAKFSLALQNLMYAMNHWDFSTYCLLKRAFTFLRLPVLGF